MNKRIALLLVLTALAAVNVFAQSGGEVSLLNTSRYASYFGFTGGKVDLRSNYIWSASDTEIEKYGALNINPVTAQAEDTRVLTDTPIEFALLSYYSQPVVKIRPVEAERVLPAGDAKLSTLKLGAALYQDILVLRFLGDTAAVGRYEGMLKFICDNNGVTRVEVENYFRNGIRSLVSEVVNEEFNKISFMIDRKYNVVMTRNPQDGQYTLSYEGYFNGTKAIKTLSGQTLEALLSAMRNSGDFSQAAINTVRAQAALIPAVIYADWKARGVARGVDALALMTDTLTKFCLDPTQATYNDLLGIYARYRYMSGRVKDPFADVADTRFGEALLALNTALGNNLGSRVASGNIAAFMKVPNDQRFNVFSTPYSVGRDR